MKLTYEGKNITKKVSVESCVHDMYAEEHGDTLVVKLRDLDQLWDKWGPKAGDSISYESGNAKTGKMYVHNTQPEPGYYTIRASSIPLEAESEDEGKWNKITKLQLAGDVAKKLGLKLKTYQVKDCTYTKPEYKARHVLEFFEDLCAISGDAFLIYDGSLILYNEKAMEQSAKAKAKTATGDAFRFNTKQKYKACTVTDEKTSYTYTSGSGAGTIERVIPVKITSTGEAESYAKNLLQYFNKKERTGLFYTDGIAEDFAAGSIIKIKTRAAGSYDGAVFISHIRHDYMNNKSKIFFRTLEG